MMTGDCYRVSDSIGNYYGSLFIRELEGIFYWGIENYDGIEWETIPASLYYELAKFHNAH